MAEATENDDTVKVAVRQCPLEEKENVEIVVGYETKAPNIILIDNRSYCFDFVLGPDIKQQELFDQLIDPLVEKVKKGFNCTALAYGQTGTGKSYTMGLSNELCDADETGVVRRCLWKLLKDIDHYDLSASFVEIYNEKALDLLNPNGSLLTKGLKLSSCFRRKILTIEDCDAIIKEGMRKRHIRPTVMNSQSSRSHVIFTIELIVKEGNNSKISHLNLVDLAGSEGVRRTGHSGLAMFEGVHINQGLLGINKIVQAMSQGKKVIPYRDTVLGSVLQDSLNSNSYLTLLACISPKRIDLSETLSTIRFVQRAKQVKITPQLHSIIKELNFKKADSKTPHKAAMNKNNNTSHLYETFCTPGKRKRMVAHFNKTEMGLTPKERKKVQNQLRVTSTALKPRVLHKNRQPSVGNSTLQRESLFEHSIETWNLNVSSSTSLDAISSISKPMSFSPIVDRCMEKFETILENKMVHLKQQLGIYPVVSARSELRNNINEEVQTKNDEVTVIPTVCSSPIAQAQLFTTSSPVFKVPKVPANDEVDLTTLDESAIDSTYQNLRRSERIMGRSLWNNSQINDWNLTINEGKKRKRGSIESAKIQRRSIIDSAKIRRRSIRIAANLDGEKKSKPKLDIKIKSKKSPVNNSVIESYFNDNISSSASFNTKMKKHRKAVLNLLNNGTMKQLQTLPQVGQKTAYKLITHRSLHGKFKSLSHVEKLPIWIGASWERFAKNNMLI